ncbi:SpoIIE family protein phosphatase [Magnetovibrio sp. PR-2]|uniref:PP2C family protein-serine/threonine phosphatase n=1 Tax=Magnetovibrio sp. PR-2 TaxID=3120356 RepID=UPI002FCE63BB
MPKTLIIDDDLEFETAIRAHFDGIGGEDKNEFVFAHSHDEALSIMHDLDDIDIAAVTIDNDHIGGLGIFRKLQDKRLRVPRIALTGTRDLSAIREAMNQGAVDFLTKPVAMDDLTATLGKVYADCEVRRKAWKTEAQLAAIRREMDLAGNIQKRILPDSFPASDDLQVFAQTTPAREMGGDFYDFFDLDNGKIAIVVADVSGKGVPAAFYMAVVRTLFRAAAPTADKPAECLDEVNRLLIEHDIPGMFVTAFYGILDPVNWTLNFANGGHCPPYLVREHGEVKAIDTGGGVVLGFEHEVPYQDDVIQFDKGDALFIYTDGLTEAFDENREQFSEERLIDCLLENRSLSAHALTDNVFGFVSGHTAGAEQSDDITSFVIKRF